MVTLNKLLAPKLEALGLTPSSTSDTDIKCCWDLGSRDTDYFWVCDVFNDHVAVRSKRNWKKGELYYYEFNAADPEFIKKVFHAIDEILEGLNDRMRCGQMGALLQNPHYEDYDESK